MHHYDMTSKGLMKTALITGANRGIGRQAAHELSARGFRVFMGARKAADNGEPVADTGGNAYWLRIDVTDTASVAEASKWLTTSIDSLDVLINNAGIFPDESLSIANISRAQLAATFQTNTFGPIDVIQAFLPMLKKSKAARVINVSSGYGQLGGLSGEFPSYCLSKLALNGVTLMFADKLRADGISVNSVDPGWVRTEMGGANASRSVEEGAAGIVWLASEAPHEITGKFFRDQDEIDW